MCVKILQLNFDFFFISVMIFQYWSVTVSELILWKMGKNDQEFFTKLMLRAGPGKYCAVWILGRWDFWWHTDRIFICLVGSFIWLSEFRVKRKLRSKGFDNLFDFVVVYKYIFIFQKVFLVFRFSRISLRKSSFQVWQGVL